MLSDIDQSELKPHEKVLRQLICNEDINTFILHILGLECVDIELLKKSVETNKKLRKPYLDILDVETLFQLPVLKTNAQKKSVNGKWQKVDGLLQISESEDYENALAEAIEEIFPLEPRQDGAIPVTLLLPNSIEMDGDNLCGKESNWQFFNIDAATNHQCLIDDKYSFFGLRLFSVFQSLGLVQPLQKKSGNKTLANILQSTALNDHFALVCSENIKVHHKKDRDFQKLSNENDKLKAQITSLNKKLDDGFYTHKNDKLSAINKEIKLVNERIKLLKTELDQTHSALVDTDKKLIVKNISNPFYYCFHSELLEGIKNEIRCGFTLPALKFPETTKYTSNIIEVDGNLPTKRSLKRMQFMLAYLFSMTCGTAITFYFKPHKTKFRGAKLQGLEAPTLILPKEWNELALAAKTHRPDKKVGRYNRENSDCEVSRDSYLQAIYYDYWYKREELMRCIPTKTGLFWNVLDDKLIKK